MEERYCDSSTGASGGGAAVAQSWVPSAAYPLHRGWDFSSTGTMAQSGGVLCVLDLLEACVIPLQIPSSIKQMHVHVWTGPKDLLSFVQCCDTCRGGPFVEPCCCSHLSSSGSEQGMGRGRSPRHAAMGKHGWWALNTLRASSTAPLPSSSQTPLPYPCAVKSRAGVLVCDHRALAVGSVGLLLTGGTRNKQLGPLLSKAVLEHKSLYWMFLWKGLESVLRAFCGAYWDSDRDRQMLMGAGGKT